MVHEMLGQKFVIDGKSIRLGHIRREYDLGVASDSGMNSAQKQIVEKGKKKHVDFPAYLIRLSTGKVVRKLAFTEQDFDAVILYNGIIFFRRKSTVGAPRVGDSPPAPRQTPGMVNMISKEQIAEWFDCFWAIYWRKVAKQDAFRAFQKQVTCVETFTRVMDGIRLQKLSMMKRNPEHRPHAATWLNGWRWNDEPDFNSGYTTFRQSSEQPEPSNEEYVTLRVAPTVPAGPTADEWRKRNAR